MEQLDFFEGRRRLTGVVIHLHRGKASLVCTPWEEWRLVSPSPFTLRCGNKRERKITRRIGIEQTEHESFASALGTTLGAKGIASVESSLKAQIGHEVKFSVGTEEQETFSFDSPVCGYKTIRLYQKVRCIHLKYDDQRFWHRAAFDQTLTQWLGPIYDGTTAEQYSPECKCAPDKQPADPGDGVPARVDMGIVAKLAGYFQSSGRLIFADGTTNLFDLFKSDGTLSGRLSTSELPDYLRFLAGIDVVGEIEATVWQESVLHPTTPDSRASGYVTIELDDDMEPIEAGLAYQVTGLIEFNEVVIVQDTDKLELSAGSGGD